jgi:hypothetical protein
MIVIELKSSGASKIIVDGRDIANYVTSITVQHSTEARYVNGGRVPGPNIPQVHLTLVGPIYVSVDGEVKIGAELEESHSFKREELNQLVQGSPSLPVDATPAQEDNAYDAGYRDE